MVMHALAAWVLATSPPLPVAPAAAHGNALVLTTIKDALTAAALLVGGGFAYFKFIKGRVLGPRARPLVHASMPDVPNPTTGTTELRVIVTVRNEGQILLRLPIESDQLLTVRSLTRRGLDAAAQPPSGATSNAPRPAASWARADTFLARTNIIQDEGLPPPTDIRLEPGEDLRVGVIFAVPAGHEAAAFLVVLNVYLTYRSWFRVKGQWWETRTVLVPGIQRVTEWEAT